MADDKDKPKKPVWHSDAGIQAKKESTAVAKAKKTVDSWQKKYNKANAAYHHAVRRQHYYDHMAKIAISVPHQQHYKRMKHKWVLARGANSRRKNTYKKSLDAAKRNMQKLQKTQHNYAAIADKIAQQSAEWRNEGKCAIYPSDGSSSTVIFISPSSAESETESTTVTSWPVDQGAPRSDYARVSSDTKTISGIVTGTTRAEAMQKYQQLKDWNLKHVELTYEGDFISHHLIMSEIGNTFGNMEDNLAVNMTFAYVQYAVINSSTGNHSKKKRSKSSKTTAGSRNKNYTAITIKPGDTLWGLGRKYHKSVSWLARVNHIKNPNLIYAGHKLYVSPKQRKVQRKMRVK